MSCRYARAEQSSRLAGAADKGLQPEKFGFRTGLPPPPNCGQRQAEAFRVVAKLPGSAWVPDREISDAEIDRIIKASGRPFPAALRQAIVGALIDYNDSLAIWAAATTPRSVRDCLGEIERAACELRDLLARLALDAGQDTTAETALDRLGDQLLGGVSFADTRRCIAYLHAAAHRAAKGLRGRPGPTGNPCRADFIGRLHAVYLQAGGTGSVVKNSGKYSGRFFMMVRDALMIIENRVLTNATVGRAIEEALSP
jgi:hypothetical protein